MKLKLIVICYLALYAVDAVLLFTLGMSSSGTAVVTAALCLALSLVLSLIFVVYLNTNVLKPIATITDYARRAATNDSVAKLEVSGAFSEIVDSIDHLRTELRREKELELAISRSRREMVTSISHNIVTPISSIRDIADLLRSRAEPGKERAQLEAIRNKADYVDELLTEMLRNVTEDDSDIDFNLNEYSSIDLYDLISNADYDKCCSYVGAIPKARLIYDEARLQNVLDHIISNAYKYAGTKVTIHNEISDNCLNLTFRDYGPGIPAEDIGEVFKKYYRGKNSSGKFGSGLGLYIAAYYMERMRGGVSCQNYTGGFGVTLSLPIAHAAGAEQLTL
jgi:signal transduction histidine kinase